MLKTFQQLGYPVFISNIPVAIVHHVVSCCELSISSDDLKKYDTSRIRRKHISIVREYLEIKAWGPVAKKEMNTAVKSVAFSKHDLADIINVAIEELIRLRFDIPKFTTLLRAARHARYSITESYHQEILQALGTKERLQLDRLFLVETESGTTQWNELKQEPGRPMLSQLRELIKRLDWLSQLRLSGNPVADIPAIKVKHFAEEAQTLGANQMKELRPDKRYCLAICLIDEQYGQTLDDLAEMFIKRMQKMHHKAKDALAIYRKAIQEKVDTLILTLRDSIGNHRANPQSLWQQRGKVPRRVGVGATRRRLVYQRQRTQLCLGCWQRVC